MCIRDRGNAAIKELQQSATIEDFQKIADDLSEQQQINDELAQIMGVDTVDDHMFEDELDQLERKEADAVACKLKPVPTDSLPEVKNKQAEKKQTEKRQAVLA
eukprot:TRINITY_DN6181_c0_g1_i1.p2 TRINITY_DN6181_c0_g1~~TRINITY_DN6181_c0_g1_i1.p2  ORF type:complete len:103 (-),score=30.44 TRINITY_DN6181_c0_g1_i1:148-456(-)